MGARVGPAHCQGLGPRHVLSGKGSSGQAWLGEVSVRSGSMFSFPSAYSTTLPLPSVPESLVQPLCAARQGAVCAGCSPRGPGRLGLPSPELWLGRGVFLL